MLLTAKSRHNKWQVSWAGHRLLLRRKFCRMWKPWLQNFGWKCTSTRKYCTKFIYIPPQCSRRAWSFVHAGRHGGASAHYTNQIQVLAGAENPNEIKIWSDSTTLESAARSRGFRVFNLIVKCWHWRSILSGSVQLLAAMLCGVRTNGDKVTVTDRSWFARF